MAVEPEPVVELPEDLVLWPDNDIEAPVTPVQHLPLSNLETPPLPEAPVSITLKATFDGQEVLVTLRGTDFATRQGAGRGSQSVAQGARLSPAPRGPEPGRRLVCGPPVCHELTDERRHRSWYSHRTDEGWCKGRR